MAAEKQTHHDTARRVRSAVDLMSVTEETFEFGSLTVAGDGRLQLGRKGPPLSFTLINRGLHLRCLWQKEPSAALLVKADLGKLPYSIEAPTGRSMIKRLIEATSTGGFGATGTSYARQHCCVPGRLHSGSQALYRSHGAAARTTTRRHAVLVLRNGENLTGIDQIRIANLVLVGLVDDRIANAFSVDAA